MDASDRGAAVVIGSAGAIGGAILRGLVAARPAVVPWMTYRSDVGAVEELAKQIPGLHPAQCDLTKSSELANLVSEVERSAGPVRVLVHAAVDVKAGPILELGHEGVSNVVMSSGLSLLTLVEAFDRLLQPGSAILYITSIGSHRVMPGYSAVGAAKAVGDAIMRYLAAELATRGIRVNSISAGPFVSKAAAAVVGDTGALVAAADAATPRGRVVDFEELGNAAVLLTSPQAGGITGQVITVDAGIFSGWKL
jgi:enoyl-[acyl-carrier-protein] reductase (NADH)